MDELTKRVLSSLFLFFVIIISLKNNYLLFCSLCLVYCQILIEFTRILKKIFIRNNLKLFLILLIILIYTFAIMLKVFTILYGSNIESKMTLLTIFLICVSTDIGGYFFGKIFKGKN